MSNPTLAEELRALPERLRRTPMPLSDLIPVLQQLADRAEHHERALVEIRDRWPFDTAEPPEPETYDDTESAYNNGMDVSTHEAAQLAKRALEG